MCEFDSLISDEDQLLASYQAAAIIRQARGSGPNSVDLRFLPSEDDFDRYSGATDPDDYSSEQFWDNKDPLWSELAVAEADLDLCLRKNQNRLAIVRALEPGSRPIEIFNKAGRSIGRTAMARGVIRRSPPGEERLVLQALKGRWGQLQRTAGYLVDLMDPQGLLVDLQIDNIYIPPSRWR